MNVWKVYRNEKAMLRWHERNKRREISARLLISNGVFSGEMAYKMAPLLVADSLSMAKTFDSYTVVDIGGGEHRYLNTEAINSLLLTNVSKKF